MPVKPRQTMEGQVDIDGFVEPHHPTVDPSRNRNALARTLTPEYFGLDMKNYTDVTVPMIEAVSAEAVQADLIDIKPNIDKNPSVASYDTTGRNSRTVYIALTPQQAKTLPRYVVPTAAQAKLTSDAKHIYPNQTDLDRANRAPAHVHESKLPGVKQLLEETQKRRPLIKKFIVASDGSNVGLSQFGTEVSMRMRFAELDETVVYPLLRAYSEQRGLNAAQRNMVFKAYQVSTIFHPDKFAHFHEFMKLADAYNQRIELACQQRVTAMEREIGKRLVDTQF